MAIFNEKIVSTKFIDPPNNTIIEVLYQEGDSVVPYILEVDFTKEDFNDLLKEVTLDEIEKTTKDLLKVESAAFEKIIETEIERRWALESEKIKKAYDDIDKHTEKAYKDLDIYAEQQKRVKFEEVQKEYAELRSELQKKFSSNNSKMTVDDITGKDLINIIESKNEDNDFVFNTKVAILEDTTIAKLKDKNVKLAIRKSKTLRELFSIYYAQKGNNV